MQKLTAAKVHGVPLFDHRTAPRKNYTGLMLAARITFAHFSVSSATSCAKLAGEPASDDRFREKLPSLRTWFCVSD
jgi:hypothetical protein